MLKDLHTQAGHAILRPVVRELNGRWERNEIEEEEYRARRLSAEYQTLLQACTGPKAPRGVKTRFGEGNLAPLQDHEVAHIWGLPPEPLRQGK